MHRFIFKLKVLVKRILGRPVSLTDRVYASIRSSDVIIDAGAHVGHHTIQLAKMTNGIVHAFEPIPTLYDHLVSNTKHLNNVHTYPYAIADYTDIVKIHVSTGGSDGSSSLLVPKEHLVTNPEVIFDQELSVKAFTFDDWMKQAGVKRVEFLWLDLQGMELSVLRASPKMLQSVRVIYTEVSTLELYSGQGVYSELKQWLESQDFKLVAESLPYGFTGDALFKRC